MSSSTERKRFIERLLHAPAKRSKEILRGKPKAAKKEPAPDLPYHRERKKAPQFSELPCFLACKIPSPQYSISFFGTGFSKIEGSKATEGFSVSNV